MAGVVVVVRGEVVTVEVVAWERVIVGAAQVVKRAAARVVVMAGLPGGDAKVVATVAVRVEVGKEMTGLVAARAVGSVAAVRAVGEEAARLAAVARAAVAMARG